MAIWVYEGEPRIEYQGIFARYRCAYDQRQRRLQDVSHPLLYQTPSASPQLELLELDEAQWLDSSVPGITINARCADG